MRLVETVALSLVVWIALVSTALAGDVQLSIRDGRVTLVATDASVGEILAQWAKVGQTKIVNLEVVPRERVTIELRNVSEEQALAVLLRRASGYIAARRATDQPGASRFDRIAVMPPSGARRAAMQRPTGADASGDDAAGQEAGERATAEEAADGSTAQGADPAPADDPMERALKARARLEAAERGDDAPPAAAAAYQAVVSRAAVSTEAEAQAPTAGTPTDRQPAHDAPPTRPMSSGLLSERRSASPVGSPRDKAFIPRSPARPAIDASPVDDEPLVLPSSGPIPTQDAATQASIKARHPIEIVDPRTFKIPAQQPPRTTAPAGASRPGAAPGGPGGDDPSPAAGLSSSERS